MRNIGITIRNLPSYEKEAKPSEAGCEQWVDKKLDIVVMAVRNMRSHLMKDWAHRDLHYGNTRWKSETEVVLIDYGKAKMPYYFTDSQGQTRDLDEKAFLRKSWIGDLCHEQRGQKVAEIPSKIINPTVPVHA
ncbi:hypothetical protein FRC18_000515 [Serendipita sp. 400]|nr:hypothetical protein FRC18_000515 [Serendipita sp. 400]